MSGKLIFVSGLTGAGKTTLVEKAIQSIPNLECLLTYTTRPIRDGEANSSEYIFVNDEEYSLLKKKSSHWDETIYNDFKYASDAEKFNQDLDQGVNVIVSVTPDTDDILEMSRFYNVKPITVWINTTAEIAYSRIKKDKVRLSRVENDSVKDEFDIIFEPTNKIDEDSSNFVKLIQDIIAS